MSNTTRLPVELLRRLVSLKTPVASYTTRLLPQGIHLTSMKWLEVGREFQIFFEYRQALHPTQH